MASEKLMPAPHILIGCTGSVASIKIPMLIEYLQQLNPKLLLLLEKVRSDAKNAGKYLTLAGQAYSTSSDSIPPEIKVVSTQHALHFFRKEEQNVIIYTDSDEWETWSSMQDPVLHIELRKWADVMIIAPLDANTLAKIANGLCDNLLTCVVRAWDFHKPLMFAPAMNTCMYEHPITATQIDLLKKLGYKEIPCISKKLACGDTGFGAMAEVPTLVSAVEQSLSSFNKNVGNTSLPSTSQSSGL